MHSLLWVRTFGRVSFTSCPVGPSLCDTGAEFSRTLSLPSTLMSLPSWVLPQTLRTPPHFLFPRVVLSILKPGSPLLVLADTQGVGAGLPPRKGWGPESWSCLLSTFQSLFPALESFLLSSTFGMKAVSASSAPPVFPVSFH